MSETFAQIDAHFHAGSESPDEALDLIFMLDRDDWSTLARVWTARPAAWRRDCAYVLHYGPAERCIPFLQRAIFDLEEDVANEAAVSLAIQMLGTGDTSLPENVRAKLIELAMRPAAKDNEELRRLLKAIDGR